MTVKRRIGSTAIAVLLLFSCAMGCRLAPWRWGGDVHKGIASWYGPGFHGRRTASGEVFDQNAMTAAHRELPFGTRVRVKNLRNGRSVIVRINDRGPFVRGRIIDLSKEAARRLDMVADGIVPVRVEVIKRGPRR
ncbi:MAG: septal ring lytic transglycosylase RlpA family protein [Nitrospiraceae bacterium]|nr:septal ring lytic transglycosylase RlpA family protein [Nitrospiraceae bacterium]